MTNLCRDAAMMPMRRAIKGLNREEIKNLKKEDTDLPVSQADLEQARLLGEASQGKPLGGKPLVGRLRPQLGSGLGS